MAHVSPSANPPYQLAPKALSIIAIILAQIQPISIGTALVSQNVYLLYHRKPSMTSSTAHSLVMIPSIIYIGTRLALHNVISL